MSKTPNTPDDNNRVATLENELRILREQHAAEMQAIRDDIRAAKATDNAGGLEKLFERLVGRVENVDPEQRARKMQAETAKLIDEKIAEISQNWQGLFSGARGYACAVLGPRGPGFDEKTQQYRQPVRAPIDPEPGLSAVVYAETEAGAEAKFKEFFGITYIETGGDRPLCFWSAPIDEKKSPHIQRKLLDMTAGDESEMKRQMEAHVLKMVRDSQPVSSEQEADSLDSMFVGAPE